MLNNPFFGPDTYGEAFADVYDDWYSTVSDVAATVEFVRARHGSGPVLELGVGTGRLALPLAEYSPVIGIDASAAMLDRCRAAVTGAAVAGGPAAHRIDLVQADLAHLPIVGPIGAALCAFNTLFNLTSEEQQLALFAQLRRSVADDGVVIIEAITGTDLAQGPGSSVGVSRMEVDRLVLSATVIDHDAQTISGQHVDISEAGIRLRPWKLRWTTPGQLDALAARAGLTLVERFESVAEDAFNADSERHVSVYRPA